MEPVADENYKIEEQAADSPNAINPLTASVSHRDLRNSAVRLSRMAARNPLKTIKHTFKLWREDLEILMGRSERVPDTKDRRFQDDAWRNNPLYRRTLQHWLALGDHFENWVADLELDELERARARFVTQMLTDAAAPSNTFIGNPTAIKRAIDTGGGSLLRGSKNLTQDLRENGGLPSQVDKSAFRVGDNIATSQGEVVWRSHLLELIHYKPATAEVYEIPYFAIPPQINKFYLFDLSPEKSLIKFLLEHGIQCFWLSWRNPDKSDRDYGMSDYIDQVVDAMDVVGAISKSDKINVGGACSGGITLATLASRLAARKDDRIKSLTFKVCVLDPDTDDTEFGRIATEKSLESARRSSQKKGVLKGSDLARVFAWMRPNDLIWNYVVNNYLLGDDPPAFDILYWNSDTTNLSASLHSDFLDISLAKPFSNPGVLELADHSVDITKVDCDAFVVAGLTDHITPWKACYRTAKCLNPDRTEFYLSSSGHIQALINPPTNPKAKYFSNPDLPDTPERWMDGAEEQDGSWWLRWVEWLQTRSGEKKKAPRRLGSPKYPGIDPAPGKYVFETAA